MTADEVAEVYNHQAVCDELRKNVHVGPSPVCQVSADVDHYVISDRLVLQYSPTLAMTHNYYVCCT